MFLIVQSLGNGGKLLLFFVALEKGRQRVRKKKIVFVLDKIL